ncbi:MAG TPA: hypothetical protein EYP98_18285, partial [Planctomycetes bacterium]|nr:hypothetical protein [Planctomycetota bacterium]
MGRRNRHSPDAFLSKIPTGGVENVVDELVVLNAAAVLTLLRPGSIPRFAFLLAAQLICFAWQLPIVVNHWMMLAFAALTVLAALLGGRPRSTDEWYARIAPFVRAQIVVVYFFATFHKINVSYFDPSLSCAADHLLKLAAKVAVVPTGDWAKYVSMYGVLLIEGGLPILLLIRRTRYATIVGGTIFHLALGVNGYHDFSAVALVFYAVFLPSDFPARLVAFAKRHPRIGAACRRVAGFSRAPIVSVAAVAVVIGLAVLSPALGWSHRDKYVMLHVPFHAIWFVVTIAAIGVLIACRRPVASATATPAPQRLSTPVRMAGTFIVFVVFLNGASPYLGLKTEHSFAMFSNLQTEGDEWNHLTNERGSVMQAVWDNWNVVVDAEHIANSLPPEGAHNRFAVLFPDNSTLKIDYPYEQLSTAAKADEFARLAFEQENTSIDMVAGTIGNFTANSSWSWELHRWDK